jgi:hypothetical protein
METSTKVHVMPNKIDTNTITLTRKIVTVGSQIGFSIPRDVAEAMDLSKGTMMQITLVRL